MAEEVIEAEATEVGTELEPVAGQTLFRTDDPAEVLTRATATAKATTHFAQWPRHGRPPRRSLQSWIAECPVHGAIGDADTEQLARAFDCPLCVQDRYGLPAIEREPVDSRGL